MWDMIILCVAVIILYTFEIVDWIWLVVPPAALLGVAIVFARSAGKRDDEPLLSLDRERINIVPLGMEVDLARIDLNSIKASPVLFGRLKFQIQGGGQVTVRYLQNVKQVAERIKIVATTEKETWWHDKQEYVKL